MRKLTPAQQQHADRGDKWTVNTGLSELRSDRKCVVMYFFKWALGRSFKDIKVVGVHTHTLTLTDLLTDLHSFHLPYL